jgi:alpha-beta hydrolase superfamily lysophospholipase
MVLCWSGVSFFYSIRGIAAVLATLAPLAAHAQTGAQTPASPASASGPVQFTVFRRATPIASEQVSVERTADGWEIVGSGRTGSPPNVATRRLRLRYDADWRPLELTLDVSVGAETSGLRTVISGTTATSEIVTGSETAEKIDTIDPRAILLPNPLFASYEAVAARLQTAAPGSSIPAYVAPQGSLSIDVREVTTERIQTLARVIEARLSRVTMRAEGASPLDVEIWGDESGRLLRVSVPSQALEIMREDVASVSTRRIVVSRPNDELVRIPGNGFSLAGTISKPSQVRPGVPLPAVVIVGGSGPVDRDETVAGLPLFGQLAGALADAGSIVVRYDKRGIGQSGGRPEAATLEDYADDLRAVVRFMSERRDVDRDRLVVAGHGEGGGVAMLAAAREGRIKGLVLFAAMGSTGAELNLAQVTRALERSNRSAAERQATIELQKKIQAAVLGTGTWDGVPEAFRAQAETPWFRSFLAFDPARHIRDIDQPILVVHGLLDTEVDPSNADRLEKLARTRDRDKVVQVVKIPGVNHLLLPATTGEIDEYASLRDQQVSPAVSTAVAGWIQSVFRR